VVEETKKSKDKKNSKEEEEEQIKDSETTITFDQISESHQKSSLITPTSANHS
jgi:hypothetical protein